MWSIKINEYYKRIFTLIITKLNSSVQSAKHLKSILLAPTATSIPLK